MKQIVDLHADPTFQDLDVALVSIAFNSAEELAAGVLEFGIVDVPMLTNVDGEVQKVHDVLK